MRRFWTDGELETLATAYRSAGCSEELDLSGLAERLKRTRFSVALKASRMGLTDMSRRGVKVRGRPKYPDKAVLHRALSDAAKRRISENGHPRGMLGKFHTPETKAVIAASSLSRAIAETNEAKSARILKGLKTKIERHGGVNVGRSRGTWMSGWREIGGKRNFYRSRWEANYARYLEWLKGLGQITDWQHEPETYWFETIKRGVRSYLPDFRVWENDGSTPLHEVKGWMDARSKTTLKRMAKYHPQEKVVVIREKAYNDIARKVGRMIDGWESGGRNDRP